MTVLQRPVLWAVALLCVLACVAYPQEAPTLITNGGAETDGDRNGWPDDWPTGAGLSWMAEDGDHFLRLSPGKPGDTVTVYRALALPAGELLLELTYRLRYTDIVPGPEGWHDGRIILHFKDRDGKELQPGPDNPPLRGSSDGWVRRSRLLVVPDGAATLEFMPALFSVQAGTVDVDDVVLRSAHAEPFAIGPAPPELRVDGNQLRTPDGTAVWLQGVNIPSLEWSVEGEHLEQSIEAAIGEWHSNVIRLPVSCAFWFGGGPGQEGDGTSYRQRVADVVAACTARGAYVILDLHEYVAPRRETLAFWRDAAERFANHPGVLFGLLNEPHDIDWPTWRHGGPVTEKREGQPPLQWQSPGMRRVLDVVREAAARNVVIAGGIDWGYDLGGIVNGFALDDPGGNGVVYDSHIYPWKTVWRDKVLATAAVHPVLIGECGCEPDPASFVPAEAQKDPAVWVPDLLGLIQANHLHWTAWCFHPSATPRLLLDWSYAPTPYWGAYAKAALGGEVFHAEHVY
jgi:endoglucanase